ncbi:MAG: hypothetical protein JWN76_3363 [Chitinophagaceae bacterium]|nr:hypothetical protein [Chitinophagaceae bacterium]
MATFLLHLLLPVFTFMHPFFVSLTDINHNAKDKALEISVRIFVDDFEKTLKQYGKTNIDLIHPSDKIATDKIINQYIQSHLKISANDLQVNYKYVGYEIQSESAWVYFEVQNVPALKKLAVTNTLLYDYDKQQINIIHAKANNKEESAKLDSQSTSCSFVF